MRIAIPTYDGRVAPRAEGAPEVYLVGWDLSDFVGVPGRAAAEAGASGGRGLLTDVHSEDGSHDTLSRQWKRGYGQDARSHQLGPLL